MLQRASESFPPETATRISTSLEIPNAFIAFATARSQKWMKQSAHQIVLWLGSLISPLDRHRLHLAFSGSLGIWYSMHLSLLSLT
jgi:hypothetical protein